MVHVAMAHGRRKYRSIGLVDPCGQARAIGETAGKEANAAQGGRKGWRRRGWRTARDETRAPALLITAFLLQSSVVRSRDLWLNFGRYQGAWKAPSLPVCWS